MAGFVGLADLLSVTYSHGLPFTEVGALDQTETPSPQENLEVMVRPEDITINPSDVGSGRIISSAFHGAHTLYGIILNSGEHVRSISAYEQQFSMGTRVEVNLSPSYRPKYFKDGYSVT